ncbi:MAG: four helix bundle protein [Candidatus Vogelbacteria bacterium]|nr:four helix bundle protein [Candidatus Vogelbacteria bacterium]
MDQSALPPPASGEIPTLPNLFYRFKYTTIYLFFVIPTQAGNQKYATKNLDYRLSGNDNANKNFDKFRRGEDLFNINSKLSYYINGMRYNNLPIFQLTYKLTLEIYKTTRQFPREYRYTLGQKIKLQSSCLMDSVVKANSLDNKTTTLEEMAICLEQLRIHLRLACDLKILGLKHFESFARQLEEISTQLIGWLDWARKQQTAPI